MSETYYDPTDLKKFEDISEFQPELGKKFFGYYNSVFVRRGLNEERKSTHCAGRCPYSTMPILH